MQSSEWSERCERVVQHALLPGACGKTIEFFHKFRIQQNKIYKKFIAFTRDWTQIACLAVSLSNHYTRMFSVFVWGCNRIIFMHGWFCPICLIHLNLRKSLNFEIRKHSSRIRTAYLLTISCSIPGGCLPRGCVCPGGCLPVVLGGGVYLWS